MGAELARDSGGSGCIEVECAAVIASKLGSHTDLGCSWHRCPSPTPVGAELARDSGGSGCIEVECAAVIASKLGSHTDLGCSWHQCPSPTPVGAELARDSGGSGCIEVECAAVIASKPAPTLISGAHGIGVHRHPLWELSLLAIAVGQAALKLNVPPSSRASPLPH